MKVISKLTALSISFVLCSCAGVNQAEYNRAAQQATDIGRRAKECLDSSPVGRRAQCGVNMYNEVQAIQYNDYGKVASLKLATSIYTLNVKVDRRQIDDADYRGEWMRAINEFSSDLEEGKRRTEAANIEVARYRQQAFINAAKLLNPPRNGVSCVSVNSGFVTTTNCY